MNPCDMSAVEMISAFARKTLSPVEVIDAVLARADAFEPSLHALWQRDDDGARKAAVESQERWARNAPLGALDGVPITIKENIATKGDPIPLGTAAADLVPAPADAPPSARVREAGAIIFAKTTMPDYGMLSSSLSSFHALARNPWDLSKTPGGSSSGAAGAAAAGYGPLHVGTDIGGSVRLPASWCGIFALKPSLGRIPIDPPFQGRVAGPMTRSVADAALLLSILSKPDARDHMSLPPAGIAWDNLEIGLRGLRIGYMPEAGDGLLPTAEVASAVAAAARFFESEGAIVDEIAPFATRDMMAGLDRFWRARAWSDIRRLSSDKRESILPFIREWAEAASSYSGEDVYSGFNQSLVLRKITNDRTMQFDFVLSPTAPIPAFDAELPCPTNDAAKPFEHIVFTAPFNMSEQPAASVNCGYTASGLPIGLQIAGRRFDDLGVLRLARAWEKLRPAQRAWPAFPG